jgi:hypothetical protein
MDPKEIIIKYLANLINDHSKFDKIENFQIPQHDLKLKFFYNF